MYDKKYLENEVKPIETVEQAKAILIIAELHCGGCAKCPVRMYETSKGSTCGATKTKARKFLEEHGIDHDEVIERARQNPKDVRAEYYDYLVSGSKEESVEQRKQKCKGTCAACINSKMHSSGILWCDSFYNFVHEDGFCYRYVDAKLESEVDKLLVDNSGNF